MAHLDLTWPSLVLVISIASALALRMVATYGARATRARRNAQLDALLASEAWRAAGRASEGEPPAEETSSEGAGAPEVGTSDAPA